MFAFFFLLPSTGTGLKRPAYPPPLPPATVHRQQHVRPESPPASESPLDDCDLFGDNICLNVQAYPEYVLFFWPRRLQRIPRRITSLLSSASNSTADLVVDGVCGVGGGGGEFGSAAPTRTAQGRAERRCSRTVYGYPIVFIIFHLCGQN